MRKVRFAARSVLGPRFEKSGQYRDINDGRHAKLSLLFAIKLSCGYETTGWQRDTSYYREKKSNLLIEFGV